MRRPAGVVIVALLFALVSVPHVYAAAGERLGRGGDPWLLGALHLASGGAGLAAAVGGWRGAPWTGAAAAAWTVLTAALLAMLGPLLGLPAEARPGLWAGAASVAATGALAAWYLHRRTRHAGARRLAAR
jgi:hypothetical protein